MNLAGAGPVLSIGRWTVALLLAIGACSPGPRAEPISPELPEIGVGDFRQVLSELSAPAVVNVWASWCLPCRAEAPLLERAQTEYGDRIAFIGIAYDDNQIDARRFLDEFGLPFPHYFDPEGLIVASLGGFGVPRTYFFAPGGDLIETHNGVIDQQTLALMIDELLRR